MSRKGNRVLLVGLLYGCGESFVEVTRDCPPPRIQSVVVTGRVLDSGGAGLPGASVMIEAGLATSAVDTVGVCSTVADWEQPAVLDAEARFREKVISVQGSFICALARGDWNGEQGDSELVKLELRVDLGAECTPESSLDTGVLDLVIGS